MVVSFIFLPNVFGLPMLYSELFGSLATWALGRQEIDTAKMLSYYFLSKPNSCYLGLSAHLAELYFSPEENWGTLCQVRTCNLVVPMSMVKTWA